MHYMHDCCENGLRERKKAATRLAIEQAAVTIACEHGYDAVTVEAIASEAGVSLRTFFNYFPAKDSAIAGPGLALIDKERAHHILEEAGGDVLKGIARVAEACVTEADPTSELMRRRRRLIHDNPALFRQHVAADARFDGQLAEIVAEHLRLHPFRRRLAGKVGVEEEARVAVMVVSSAVHYRIRRAMEDDVDVAVTEKDIERTIDMMAEIHGRGA